MAWNIAAVLYTLFPALPLCAQVGRPEVYFSSTEIRQRRLLLQVGSKQQRGQAQSHQLAATASKSQTPHGADWFAAFDVGEAETADHSDLRDEGWKSVLKSEAPTAMVAKMPKSSAFLDTSQSKEQKEVQGVTTGVKAESVKGSQWLQHEVTSSTDMSLRSISGNLTCSDPGCAANVTLKVYDPLVEYVQNCTLSFAVHATDFDDNFAGEKVANLLVNGRALSSDCYPMVNGCVSNFARDQLFPCARDVPVDTIVSSKGILNVKAEIPKVVDECPYKGNLLHGVSAVTCQVGKITTTTTTPVTTTTTPEPVYPLQSKYVERWLEDNPVASGAITNITKKWQQENPGRPLEEMPGYGDLLKSVYRDTFTKATEHRASRVDYVTTGRVTSLNTSAAMRCAARGCTAHMLLSINQTLLTIDKCLVQVWVNQTDFDNQDGSDETFSLNVSSKQVLAQVKPGKNPCRSLYNSGGKPLSLEEKRYHALEDLDVTEAVKKGPVSFAATISHQVDECSSNGYLLDAAVDLACNVSTIGALLQDGQVTVPDVLHLNQVLLDADSGIDLNAAVKDFQDLAKNSDTANATDNAAENLTSSNATNSSGHN
eukprot:TRINITY_DN4676_c0_g1_i1.p1 TRINITY_DN4676_c0_g1~~TRINITY_DN4676_c0_g1_i1.p1  ORF type:complete len:598 (+),score=114.37 TRINITY_DN4676_c0_g1_i1:122-1915(+)